MRQVAASLEELLAGATERTALQMADSKSGASLERVVIRGQPHIVKYLHVDDDWLQRICGDLGCLPLAVWRNGVLDRVPDCIDHAVVGMAAGLGRNGWGAALLMRDVGRWLVPEGGAPVPLEQHLRFMDHMAALHAQFWGWDDDGTLMPRAHRYLYFNRYNLDAELARPDPPPVPEIAVRGWQCFFETSPLATPVRALRDEPWPVVDALGRQPQTLLHGDWKMGNLGSHPDGRTILLDWAMPGRGCVTSELTWYLALNAARLPHPKDDAIAAYRAALERLGVDTAGWWDAAVDLALLGALVQFGWEKALGDRRELAWWEAGAARGLDRL
ncbi:MAG: hypothetical protein QOE35_2124 [Actinomycetota bacterium]|jgi:hypothetical protein